MSNEFAMPKELPVNEIGMLQLFEAIEREIDILKSEKAGHQHRIGAQLKSLRKHRTGIIERLDQCRNGELLDFRPNDTPAPDDGEEVES